MDFLKHILASISTCIVSWGFSFSYYFILPAENGVGDMLLCHFRGPLDSFTDGGSILNAHRCIQGSHFQFSNSWRPKATFCVHKLTLKPKFPGPISRSDTSIDLAVHVLITQISCFLSISSIWEFLFLSGYVENIFLSHSFVVIIVIY